jgi:hypothetical protein
MCEDEQQAIETFGVEVAAALHARLADLRAAESVLDLVAGRSEVRDGVPPVLVLSLPNGGRMLCSTNQANLHRDAGGSIDWRRVRRLRVDSIDGVLTDA